MRSFMKKKLEKKSGTDKLSHMQYTVQNLKLIPVKVNKKQKKTKKTLQLYASPGYKNSITQMMRLQKQACLAGDFSFIEDTLSGKEKLSLLKLLLFHINCHKSKGYLDLAIRTIANHLHISERHVQRLHKMLEELGLLSIFHRKKNRRGRFVDAHNLNEVNRYVLLDIFKIKKLVKLLKNIYHRIRRFSKKIYHKYALQKDRLFRIKNNVTLIVKCKLFRESINVRNRISKVLSDSNVTDSSKEYRMKNILQQTFTVLSEKIEKSGFEKEQVSRSPEIPTVSKFFSSKEIENAYELSELTHRLSLVENYPTKYTLKGKDEVCLLRQISRKDLKDQGTTIFWSNISSRIFARFNSTSEFNAKLNRFLRKNGLISQLGSLVTNEIGEYAFVGRRDIKSLLKCVNPSFFGLLLILSFLDEVLSIAFGKAISKSDSKGNVNFNYFLGMCAATVNEKYANTPTKLKSFTELYEKIINILSEYRANGQSLCSNYYVPFSPAMCNYQFLVDRHLARAQENKKQQQENLELKKNARLAAQLEKITNQKQKPLWKITENQNIKPVNIDDSKFNQKQLEFKNYLEQFKDKIIAH